MREPGFYWVKQTKDDWIIAEWANEKFIITGWRNEFVPEWFEEIDEQRIVREEVAKQRMGNNGLRRVL